MEISKYDVLDDKKAIMWVNKIEIFFVMNPLANNFFFFQEKKRNFIHLLRAKLHYVGSLVK